MPDHSDAFDALRRPIDPARPRPQFVIALRRRLQEELNMIITDDIVTTPVDHGALGLVHLRVGDAERAMRFFAGAFGWIGERFDGDGGTSYYTLNTAVTVRLLDDSDAVPVRPNYQVRDVATAVQSIEAAGGRITDAGVEPDGGGWAYAEDRAGLPILVYRPSRGYHPTSDAAVTGDVGLVFVTEDAVDAAAFYGPVLGWQLTAGHPGSTYYDTVEHVGIWDEGAALRVPRPPSLTLFLEVPALEVAAETILVHGGTVGDLPAETDMGPYYSVRCTDDQGTGFALLSTRLNM